MTYSSNARSLSSGAPTSVLPFIGASASSSASLNGLALGDIVLERLQLQRRIGEDRVGEEIVGEADALERSRVLVGRQHQRAEFRDDVELAVQQQRRHVGIVRLHAVGRGLEADADIVEPALLHPDVIEGVVGVGPHAELDRRLGNVRAGFRRRGHEAIRRSAAAPQVRSAVSASWPTVSWREVQRRMVDLLSHALLRNGQRHGLNVRTGGAGSRPGNWHPPCNGCANRTRKQMD